VCGVSFVCMVLWVVVFLVRVVCLCGVCVLFLYVRVCVV